MTHYKKLVGERCYLSPVAVEDGELWAEWLNDLEVTLPLGDEAYEMIPGETARGWAASAANGQEPVFTIVEKATERAIGRCLLFGIHATDRSAECGLFIGEKSLWGQGLGSEALALLLDYAFNLLNLNSVMLGAFSFNLRALASYRKLGFREIGRRRQARVIAGKAYDVVLMDLLAEEFSSPVIKKMAHFEGDLS
jgi:RimJ/RimL family protein N-acetyltransferase